MAKNLTGKKNPKEIPGIVVECKSGRFLAYYDHRTDIIANGESEIEAKKNLKEMYAVVKKHEDEQPGKSDLELPASYIQRPFTEKLSTI